MIRLVNISRLIESLHLATPAGIDRVEMAYVQHFLTRAREDDVRFVVNWPHFTGVLDSGYVRPLIEEAALRWALGHSDSPHDQKLLQLREILHDHHIAMRARTPIRIGQSDTRQRLSNVMARAAIMLKSHVRPLSWMLGELREKGAWYVHVSTFRLNRPHRFLWMPAASVRGLFMLHDLLPIEYPEYFRPGDTARHLDRLDTIVTRANVIVANSLYTQRSLLARFNDAAVPRCEVVPLGISMAFAGDNAVAPVQSDIPYFVVVGTIEPRKNLEFLLTLWRRWTDDGRLPRAHLVIVGRRGWEIENVANLLDRSVGLAPTVMEVRSLSDTGLSALLRGATALIAPSWAEGFGLPIAEALALGVPVLAADNDAHREVGGSFVEYIGPLDGRGWMQALDDYIVPGSKRRRARMSALKDYRPPTWSDHFARVEELMQ